MIRSSRRSAATRSRCSATPVPLAPPSNAYIYNWNMLPLGQLLWEKELFSYKDFPPMQAPETYNLDGILKEMQAAGHPSS